MNTQLKETIADVTNRLRQGRFPNEQAISQGIVLRLLQVLGWDTWDAGSVWPEYQTGEGRADFALCHPPTKPAIFIEVKQPGGAESSVRQALEYAFHTGVPMIVLTDGKTWSFYLPAEQGTYDERRVYKLDLFERPCEEAAEALQRYLSRQRVESGEALEVARKEYRNRNRRSQARSAIPEAWRELVEKGDEGLVEILANAVESKAGIRPDTDDAAEFLLHLAYLTPPERSPIRRAPITSVSGTPSVGAPRTDSPLIIESPNTNTLLRRGQLSIRGVTYAYPNAKEGMVIVFRELAKEDPSFLERCAMHPDAQGRKRRYIARTAEELYPDRPDLRKCCDELPGGWLISTNLNNVLKGNLIRIAAEVSGLRLGSDIVVEF